MRLKRYALVDNDDWVFDGEDEIAVTTQEIEQTDDGEYYRAADVNTLLARIREAVNVERAASRSFRADGSDESLMARAGARDTLDALLAEVD